MIEKFNNTFRELQADFEKHTGLKAKDNWPIYIAYYQARRTDNLAHNVHQIAMLLDLKQNRKV